MKPAAVTVSQPAEWQAHAAVWTAWPSHQPYWGDHFVAARRDVAGFLRALLEPVAGASNPEQVHVWADGDEAVQSLRAALGDARMVIHREAFGDIWFRDIAPVFVHAADGSVEHRCFRNNGWGGKYPMGNDTEVAQRIAAISGLPGHTVGLVFEGGSLDVDGNGLALTTRSCLLNTNRNPQVSQAGIEAVLRAELGVRELIWLDDGLLNDHTDGHIDNIARFVAPGHVLCQHPHGEDDPNREVLQAIEAQLRDWRGVDGTALQVSTVVSPGKVELDAALVPASHMNFYIANHKVLVPVYGAVRQNEALAGIAALFPGRQVVGLPARGVLGGGGAFHCITQQQPSPRLRD